MQFDPAIHHRRSIRWKGYDYSQRGLYFVTIALQGRRCLFGKVNEARVNLTAAGLLIEQKWLELPHVYGGIALDEFVVMPNHFHGIVVLVSPFAGQKGQAQGPAPTLSLPDVVHRFKTLTTTQYIRGVKTDGWPSFDGRLGQRNYHERVIRNSNELTNTQRYIHDNPLRWEFDRLNPNAKAIDDKDPWL
ncbi:MAG: transposase [Candidatus Acidiferrales bacterium]